jgi:hypothetical protein
MNEAAIATFAGCSAMGPAADLWSSLWRTL